MEPAQLGRGYTGRGMGGASRGAVGGASPEGWGGAMGGAKRGGWGYGRSQQRDGAGPWAEPAQWGGVGGGGVGWAGLARGEGLCWGSTGGSSRGHVGGASTAGVGGAGRWVEPASSEWSCGTGAGLRAEPPRGGRALFPPPASATPGSSLWLLDLLQSQTHLSGRWFSRSEGPPPPRTEGTQGSASSSPGSPPIIQMCL